MPQSSGSSCLQEIIILLINVPFPDVIFSPLVRSSLVLIVTFNCARECAPMQRYRALRHVQITSFSYKEFFDLWPRWTQTISIVLHFENIEFTVTINIQISNVYIVPVFFKLWYLNAGLGSKSNLGLKAIYSASLSMFILRWLQLL